MILTNFRDDMVRLATILIPTIGEEYRATEEDTEPSMAVTVGADVNGWNFQTGDNSFTGDAYSFADWAVTYLTRDTKPDDFADDVIRQLQDVETDIFE